MRTDKTDLRLTGSMERANNRECAKSLASGFQWLSIRGRIGAETLFLGVYLGRTLSRVGKGYRLAYGRIGRNGEALQNHANHT